MLNDADRLGSAGGGHPLKPCQGPCKRDQPPEGGVQMTPAKWVCGGCWRARSVGRR